MQPKTEISYKESIVWTATALVVLLVIYSALCIRQKARNPKDASIPNLSQLQEGWHMVSGWEKIYLDEKEFVWKPTEVWLTRDLMATYSRHLTGMFLGSVLAVFVGISMAVDRRVESALELPLRIFSRIPPTAMLPVYFVLAGTGFPMFVTMVAAGIFPTLVLSIYLSGKTDMPVHATHKAYTLGASHFEVIWCVLFRQILPRIIEAIRASVGPGMVFLIAAEMLLADKGFGYVLRTEGHKINFPVIFIYLAVLGITGYMIDWFLKRVRQLLCPWFT